jgi:protein transport protein DSL1/ZW10
MSLQDAVIGLKAYKEVEERMEQLWHNLDAAIMSPRLNMDATSLPSIKAESVSFEPCYQEIVRL